MEVEQQQGNTWDGYVDWRNKPAIRGVHGGMRAATFVLVVEVLENLAFLANASNLVLYLREFMHFSPSNSAISVTNFMGTAFLLALLGGFLCDAFYTSFFIFILSAFVELLGLVILTIQAQSKTLKPPKCTQNIPCKQVHGSQAAMLFLGLYLVALGVGGIKGSLPTHGAEQFDTSSPHGRKRRSTFFNYFVFSLACGALIAVTLVVWIEDNKGWQWGFGMSTLAIFLSIPFFLLGSPYYKNKIPRGSPFTTILKVLLSAVMNSFKSRSSSNAIASMGTSPLPTPVSTYEQQQEVNSNPNKVVAAVVVVHEPISESENLNTQSESLKFLNRATFDRPSISFLSCSVQQVEEVKIVLKILPIFACTIVLNCCLAQLSTFSVQQAASMNTKIGSLKVPPASLPIFPVIFIMILAPVYDHFIIPFARKLTKTEMGISHLQRIGIGLVLSIIAMAVAAIVEIKRKQVAIDSGLFNNNNTAATTTTTTTTSSNQPLPITFLWIALQYLFLGSADLFSLAGLLEFFFTEAPMSMRSLATALSWASLAMGYYLSSAIVSIVNSVTGGGGSSNNRPWLSGTNLNHYHLERFYWLMCALSGLNFLHYLFWAMKYKYRSTGAIATTN